MAIEGNRHKPSHPAALFITVDRDDCHTTQLTFILSHHQPCFIHAPKNQHCSVNAPSFDSEPSISSAPSTHPGIGVPSYSISGLSLTNPRWIQNPQSLLSLPQSAPNLKAFQELLGWLKRNTRKGAYCLEHSILNWKDLAGNTILHVAALNDNNQEVQASAKEAAETVVLVTDEEGLLRSNYRFGVDVKAPQAH
ncbi:hypothetical protein Ahy_B01g052972 isoform A [Arachis hypogaea]|uniref:Uncharacterized protein n=1 Tax=Arachis hypogaea TaxID=3818 RepID=A0A445AQR6_ARAHY|nr:hypothetical protein Ahy_B01g052972 isoform A [Arachis hypogaea]